MRKSNVIFKTYNQQQRRLLPFDLEELAEKTHPVRVINTVIDQLNIDGISSRPNKQLSSAYASQSTGICLHLQ